MNLREKLLALGLLEKEVRELLKENKINEAEEKMEEVRSLDKEISILKDLEKREKEEVRRKANKEEELEKLDKKESKTEIENRAFNKAVLGKKLDEEERKLVETVDTDGGYLVPRDQKTTIKEHKRRLVSLKPYTNVLKVNTMAGSMPLEVDSKDELVEFEELTQMQESSLKFGNIKWSLSNYGDLIPVSTILLQDEQANLFDFIGRRFAKKAVRTENAKIIEKLKEAKKIAGKDYKDIVSALNKELDPAIRANSIIVTNQSGFDYLDQLADGNDRPMLVDSLTQENTKIFKGKPVIVLNDEYFKGTSGKMPFFIGDMSEYLAFFDRGVYGVSQSEHAGFTMNAVLLKVIERFDVQIVDKAAGVLVEIEKLAEIKE